MNSLTDNETLSDGAHSFPYDQLVIAREAQGLSQQAAADSLHLPLRYIEWLETGDFEKLPSMVFARGYLSSYAKLLQLDVITFTTAFDRLYGSPCQKTAIHSVSKVQQQVKMGDPVMRVSGWLFLLLILAVVVWWWETQYGLAPVQAPASSATTDMSSAPELSSSKVEGNKLILPVTSDIEQAESPSDIEAGNAAQPDEDEPPRYLSAEETAQLKQQLTDEEPAAVPVANNDSVSVAVEQSAASPAGGLFVRFSQDCWLQAKDRQGNSLYSGLKRSGEQLILPSADALTLRIGKVSAVEAISFNGKPVDLSTFRQKNVATLHLPQAR